MSTDKTSGESADIMKFPCEFTLKVFGLASDEFEMEVITLTRRHVKNLRENALATRYSRDRKYLAISVTFTAESKEQLDNLYQELSANRRILMAI